MTLLVLHVLFSPQSYSRLVDTPPTRLLLRLLGSPYFGRGFTKTKQEAANKGINDEAFPPQLLHNRRLQLIILKMGKKYGS